MKTKPTLPTAAMFRLLAILALTFVVDVAGAAPVVSNVRAAQRVATQLVDVYYDLASPSNALAVSISVSTNGGASYTLPATSFYGRGGGEHCVGDKQEAHLERRGGLADQFLDHRPLPRLRNHKSKTPVNFINYELPLHG